ncbi:VOC family protein [Shewanella sp. AS16]|uniref:VOC family protein n=1 Tax=Shewanella sp. AS16 TaxID=2907625 RepID=UPI001F23F02D|nr:VOC family protein [Shewanella sp. AS16]MCE9686286.1 VOC family protein [Shewanella sp. AS16]
MTTLSLGLQHVRVVALAVTDMARATKFYGETLGLAPAYEHGIMLGYGLGPNILMLKDDWYGTPTAEPNPRITLACDYAPDTAAFLQARGVTIADAVVAIEEGFYIGSFLDSEGNKLWFCSPLQRQENQPE